ncbi:MAG: hypothetical protein HUK21_12275 [Fibrobacteraceae bacterium]|nr:hypothetical protein [Fibrobacteraceae bacterium]
MKLEKLLFKSKALKVAKMVLRHFDYSIKKTEQGDSPRYETHPFWIDMSRLFELFVYGKLNENPKYRECIKFKVKIPARRPE